MTSFAKRATRSRPPARRSSGASDHGVTHSLYIENPDGTNRALYIDVQPARWKDDPSAVFAEIKPLRL